MWVFHVVMHAVSECQVEPQNMQRVVSLFYSLVFENSTLQDLIVDRVGSDSVGCGPKYWARVASEDLVGRQVREKMSRPSCLLLD